MTTSPAAMTSACPPGQPSTFAVIEAPPPEDEDEVTVLKARTAKNRYTSPFAAEPRRLTVRFFSSVSSRRPHAASLKRHRA